MSTKFVFIDSNIYCRVATQALPGCETDKFNEVKRLASTREISLLLPEVVLLEVEKFLKVTFPRKLESETDKLRSKIQAVEGWNELTTLRKAIVSEIDSIRDRYADELRTRADQITEFLNSDNVIRIPLDGEIVLAAHRAAIGAKIPDAQNFGGDCLLIESLVAHFNANADPDEFHFCSENHSHFAQELKSKSKDRAYRLHPLIQERLPPAVYSGNLKDLVAFVKETARPASTDLPPVTFHEPVEDWFFSPTSGVTQELPMPSGINWSAMLPTTSTTWPVVSGSAGITGPLGYESGLTDQFSQIQTRNHLLREIDMLLRACRGTKSWNFESEQALPEWLESIPETQIVDAPTHTLHQIYLNLFRYLERHKELDRSSSES